MEAHRSKAKRCPGMARPRGRAGNALEYTRENPGQNESPMRLCRICKNELAATPIGETRSADPNSDE